MPTNPKPKPETSTDRFTEAAKRIFNLPKADVEKIKAKTPTKRQQKPESSSH